MKTVEVQASGGSNPSLSVFLSQNEMDWSGGRAAEGASLLRKYTGNGIPGSNPGHSVFGIHSTNQITEVLPNIRYLFRIFFTIYGRASIGKVTTSVNVKNNPLNINKNY